MAIDDLIFSIDNVSVDYGLKRALDGISLQLHPGDSLGLLGINGAGKTSTIRSLLGLVKPKKGGVRVMGEKPGKVEVLKKIGFAPEDGVPPEYLSSEEYLGFVASFKVADLRERENQVQEILKWFELDPKKRIANFSKGMRRRVLLAQAFLGNPKLLILDEPLNGLDPLIILKLRDRLEKFVKEGGTVLFSSHLLGEVEKLCSRIVILSQGIVKCDQKTETLVSEFGSIENAFSINLEGRSNATSI